MNIKENLFWQKYRPQTLADAVLPKRIYDYVKDGIQANLIFSGTSGLGKTTLAMLLTRHYPTLVLKSGLGVDALRDTVRKFCQSVGQISFDEEQEDAEYRVVYFEEFDRATKALQEELKAFMEDYSDRVRFIATTNSTKGMDKNLLSRFTVLDFTSTNNEEVLEMKRGYARRIIDALRLDGIELPKEVLRDVINRNYPDFRRIWQDIQYFVKTNSDIAPVGTSQSDENLFELVMFGSNPVDNWNYLSEHWVDKTSQAFAELGRPFLVWVQKKHPQKAAALGEALVTYSDYVDVRLPNAVDPLVTLCALVYKYQQIFGKA